MANQKMTFEIDFIGKTDKLQSELNNLKRQLDGIANLDGKNLTHDVQQASKAALEMQNHLQKAFDNSNGKFDIGAFQRSIEASGKSISQLAEEFTAIGPEGQQAFINIARQVANAEVPIKRTYEWLEKMKVTLMNTIRWQISTTALRAFTGAIQTAYNYSKDLDRSLNNIRIVTGKNIDQMAKFAQQANKAAQALSSTTLDYTNASLIYYQQGLSDEDVKARTDVTVKLANVTRQSAETVSDQLTAIWNNFDNGSKSMEYFADVLTSLGATTASSSAEIAGGLEKFAAAAKTTGLSYEYAASALATIVAVTRQSEDTVGTGLRTVLGRIESLNMGETLDDNVTLTKYTKALEQAGVQVLDQNKQLKTADEILDSLAAKWQTLNETQKQSLAYTIGGVRQYTTILALMDNWDKMQKNLNTASDSEGTLQQQQDIYAESWEAARDRVTAAMENVYDSIINPQFFIDLDKSITPLINTVARLIDGFGGVSGILLLVMQYMNQTFNAKTNKTVDSFFVGIQGGLNKIKDTKNPFAFFGGVADAQNKFKKETIESARDNILSAIPDSNESSLKLQLDFLKKDAELREIINENSDKLTQSEKEGLEFVKQRIDLYQKAAISSAEEAKAAQSRVEQNQSYANFKGEAEANKNAFASRLSGSVKGNIRAWAGGALSSSNVDKLKTQGIDLTQGNGSNINGESLFTITETLGEQLGTLQIRYAELKSLVQNNDIQQDSDEFQQKLKEINSYLGPGSELIGNSKADFLADLDARIQTSNDSLNRLVEAIIRVTGATQEQAQEMRAAITDIIRKANATERSAEADRKAGQIAEETGKKVKENALRYSEASQSLTTVVQTGMAFMSTLSGMQRIMNTLSDDSLSGIDKITSGLTSLCSVFMVLINLSKMATPEIAILVGIVSALITAYQWFSGANDRARDSLNQSISSYKEAKSALESLNSELETTKDKIKELESQPHLTLVEQEELDKLRQQNLLLERRKQLQEDEVETKEFQMAEDARDFNFNADKLDAKFREEFKKLIDGDLEGNYDRHGTLEGIYQLAKDSGKSDAEAQKIQNQLKDRYRKVLLDNSEDIKTVEETYLNLLEAKQNGSSYVDDTLLSEYKLNLRTIKDTQARARGSTYFDDAVKPALRQLSSQGLAEIYDAAATGRAARLTEKDQNILDILGISLEQGDITQLGNQMKDAKKAMEDSGLFEDVEAFYNSMSDEQKINLLGINWDRVQINTIEEFNAQLNQTNSQLSLLSVVSQENLQSLIDAFAQGKELTKEQNEELNKLIDLYPQLQDMQYYGYSNMEDILKQIRNATAISNAVSAAVTQSKEVYTNLQAAQFLSGYKDTDGNYYSEQEIINKYEKDEDEDGILDITVTFNAEKGIAEIHKPNGVIDTLEKETIDVPAKIELQAEEYEDFLDSLDNIEKVKLDVEVADFATSMQKFENSFSKIDSSGKVAASELKNILILAPELAQAWKSVGNGQVQFDQQTLQSAREASKGRIEAQKEEIEAQINKIQTERNMRADELELQLKDAQDILENSEKDAQATIDLSEHVNTFKAKMEEGFVETSTELTKTGYEDMVQLDQDYYTSLKQGMQEIGLPLYNNFYQNLLTLDTEYNEKRLNNAVAVTTDSIQKAMDGAIAEIATDTTKQTFTTSVETNLDAATFGETYGKLFDQIAESGGKVTREFAEEYVKSLQEKINMLRDTSWQIPYLADMEGSLLSLDKNTGKLNKTLKETLERYHEITREIQIQERLIKQLDTDIERAYGAKRLKLMQQQVEAYNTMLEKQKLLSQAAHSFIVSDLGDIMGDVWDEAQGIYQLGIKDLIVDQITGEIKNYTEILSREEEKNRAVQNSSSASDTQKEAAKNRWELVQKYFQNYENSLDKYNEALEKERELERQIADARLKQINTIYEEQKAYQDLIKTIREYNNNFDNLGKDEMGKALNALYQYQDIISDIFNESIPSIQQRVDDLLQEYARAQYDDAINIKDVLNDLSGALTDIYAQMNEYINKINEYIDALPNYLEQVAKGFDEIITKYQNSTNLLTTYDDIINLSGRNMTKDQKRELRDSIASNKEHGIQQQYKANSEAYKKFKDLREKTGKELEALYKKYPLDEFGNRNVDKQTEVEIAQKEAAYKKYEELEKKYHEGSLASTKEYYELIGQIHKSNLDDIMQDMQDAFTNGYGFDFANLKMDNLIEQDKRHLDAVNALYETNKLNNKIQSAIDSTTNKAGQARLEQLKNELALMKEKNKMSQFDVDLMNKKIELTLAENALEEARNAKNQLRLVRDSQGNWSYQYSANADAIDGAQQNYNDKLNEYYNFSKNYFTQTSQDILNIEKWMYDEIGKIKDDDVLRDEKIAEIKKMALDKFTYAFQEQGKAFAATQEAGALAVDGFTSEYLDKLAEQVGAENDHKENVEETVDKIMKEHEAYDKKVEEVAESTGSNYNDIKTAINEVDTSMRILDASMQVYINTTWKQLNKALEDTADNFVEIIAYIKQLEGLGMDADQIRQILRDNMVPITKKTTGTMHDDSVDYTRLIAAAVMTGEGMDVIAELVRQRKAKIQTNGGTDDTNAILAEIMGYNGQDMSKFLKRYEINDLAAVAADAKKLGLGGITYSDLQGKLSNGEKVINLDGLDLSKLMGLSLNDDTLITSIESDTDRVIKAINNAAGSVAKAVSGLAIQTGDTISKNYTGGTYDYTAWKNLTKEQQNYLLARGYKQGQYEIDNREKIALGITGADLVKNTNGSNGIHGVTSQTRVVGKDGKEWSIQAWVNALTAENKITTSHLLDLLEAQTGYDWEKKDVTNGYAFYINADFPNVTSSEDIQQAFFTLPNTVFQNRKIPERF